ncbi:MAG: hypothetical protein WCX16_03765 [Candidatus Omnitrophota bacterium]
MKLKKFSSNIVYLFITGLLIGLVFYAGYQVYRKYIYEKKILQEMVKRLQADSRVAEVIVTDVGLDAATQKQRTTIKFLEFDSLGQPLAPKYFTFLGNLIQFQSLVVRFNDALVASGDSLRGKSVFLFWKAFVLDGSSTQEYIITPIDEIPSGYKIKGLSSAFESGIWKEFWDYALNSKKASIRQIKNAQIEAPGTKFVPGIVYTLNIEHDGGIRIDTSTIPPILQGERIL